MSGDGDQTHTILYYGTLDNGTVRRFEQATLPGSPCVDEQWCTYRPAIPEDSLVVLTVRDSTLQWIHPLGDGEYLAFYVVDRRPGAGRIQNAILVGRERGRPAAQQE